jgi:hypothetical protein
MTKLSFEMALANMKRGKMVRRASEPGVAFTVKEDRITVWQRVIDGGTELWEYVGMDGYVLAADILAEDWEVVEL